MKKCSILFLLIVFAVETQATIRYVRPISQGSGDGSSWANASNDLQAMMNALKSTGGQVWVAAGTYKPIYKTANTDIWNVPTNDRNKSFVLVKDVQVYGGFQGLTTDTSLDQRNWYTYETILSGDIGISGYNADNSYHVVISAGDVGTACIDGFTITKANANGDNANVVPSDWVYLLNGELIWNSYGGGLLITFSSPKLVNLKVANNYGTFAAGIVFSNYCLASDVKYYNTPLTLTNVSFTNNVSYSVIRLEGNSNLTNVAIINNSSSHCEIELYGNASDSHTFINVTISNYNKTNRAIRLARPLNIYNSIIWGNYDSNYDTVNYGVGTINYYNCLIGGMPIGNGIILNCDPLFMDMANGNYRLSYCSPAINAGNNANVPAGVITDIDVNQRVVDSRVDLGAYEWQGNSRVRDTTFYLASFCQGKTYTDNNFNNLTTAGMYYDTLQDVNGCDSIIELTLSFYPGATMVHNYSDTICKGTTYSDIYFSGLTQIGTYHDTLRSVHGCDSLIINFTLHHYPSVAVTNYSDTICYGKTYNDANFSNLTQAGTYYDTVPNINGCDSIIELTLIVNPITKIDSIIANSKLLCEGDELRIEVVASGKNLVYQWYKDSNILFAEQDKNFIVSAVTQAHNGKYYVEVTGICGDATSQKITIDASGANVLAAKWDDVILADNSKDEFIGYQWYKNGRIIDGAKEQFYQEIGGLNGCYSVELTLTNGSRMRSCERCAYKTVKSNEIYVYPNPTSNQLKIRISDDRYSIFDIRLYDIVGKEIQSAPFNSPEGGKLPSFGGAGGGLITIDISHLSAGLYFLKIDNKVIKFIKE